MAETEFEPSVPYPYAASHHLTTDDYESVALFLVYKGSSLSQPAVGLLCVAFLKHVCGKPVLDLLNWPQAYLDPLNLPQGNLPRSEWIRRKDSLKVAKCLVV